MPVAVKEFWRVLKRDGLLMLKEPAYEWLRSKHDERGHAKRRYTRGELSSLLEQAGFRTRKSSYIGFFILPVAILVRLLEKARVLVSEESSHRNIPLVSSLFKWSLYLEAWLLNYIRLPFGLSVFICAGAQAK